MPAEEPLIATNYKAVGKVPSGAQEVFFRTNLRAARKRTNSSEATDLYR